MILRYLHEAYNSNKQPCTPGYHVAQGSLLWQLGPRFIVSEVQSAALAAAQALEKANAHLKKEAR